jgi:hypothetical protein
MKKLTLSFLTCACVALVLTPASARADDKKHKKHHHEYLEEPKGHYGESGLYHDGVRDHNSDSHHYSGDRVVVREVRRREYPRQVVVYQNRSYDYDYYEVQTVLRRDGYYSGPLDGDFGPGSRAALVRYQRDHGWRDDGRIDGQLIINLGLGH